MTGPVLVGAVLLVWAGLAKARRPDGTARALRAAGLPAGPAAVRALAVAEALVGVGAVAVGGPFLVAMACSYAGFAGFIALAMWRRWPLSSCGCFGVADARPSLWHLVSDTVLAAAGLAAAADGLRPLHALAHRPPEGVALTLLAVVIAGLLVLLLSVLPSVAAA